MSFSANIKMEVVRVRPHREAARAQLAALTHAAGAIRLGRVLGVEYVTETLEVGRQIAMLATTLYQVKATIAIRDVARRRGALTVVTLEGAACETLLTDAGLLSRTAEGVELLQTIPDALIKTPEMRLAFLRGAYLGAGTCTNPKRGYHMEIICRGDAFADTLIAIMEDSGCGAKRTLRKDKIVVYLKEGDRIAAFLALVGASSSTLAFEDVRVERDVRNYINRTNNCVTANIDKTVNAATEQVMAIEYIKQHHGLQRLSPVLREMAELRLSYPGATLQELCDETGMGKSCIYHRLSRLVRMAKELGQR